LSNTDQTDNLFWVTAQEWALFAQIAASPFATFNPIRECITHPERYLKQGPDNPNPPWVIG
jgi:hypothetical protein